jgi:hypothetical protein
LNQAVRRNIERFPEDFMLRLTADPAWVARKLEALERRYDAQFKVVFDAIRELMAPPQGSKKRPIGFTS